LFGLKVAVEELEIENFLAAFLLVRDGLGDAEHRVSRSFPE
jgi:hypothetical protein